MGVGVGEGGVMLAAEILFGMSCKFIFSNFSFNTTRVQIFRHVGEFLGAEEAFKHMAQKRPKISTPNEMILSSNLPRSNKTEKCIEQRTTLLDNNTIRSSFNVYIFLAKEHHAKP